MITVECEYCGKSFLKRKADIRKTSHNFCGRKCFSDKLREFDSEKFWNNAIKNNETGCLEWSGRINQSGYGQVRYNGRLTISSRVAYELTTGSSIPIGMCVCHHCDNPKCIEPTHLFIGTHTENMRDMISKQRHNHKLSCIDIFRIRYQKVSENRKSSNIIKPDGISERTIRRVLQKDKNGEYKYYQNIMPLPQPPKGESK